MEELRKEIISAILAGNIEQLRKLEYKLWDRQNKKLHRWPDQKFMDWVNSVEGQAIQAHLHETY